MPARVHETPPPPQSQFYLHDQPQVPRRTWGQPQPIQLANDITGVGYNQSMDSRYNPPPGIKLNPNDFIIRKLIIKKIKSMINCTVTS